MKRLLLLFTLLPLLCGCTQNNGYIGRWFGTWKLECVTIDGEPDAAYRDDIFWKFQNNIIEMVKANDKEHEVESRWGTWETADGDKILMLNFNHSATIDGEVNTWTYTPFSETHLPRGILHLRVDRLGTSSIRLTYEAENGTDYHYLLKKWG